MKKNRILFVFNSNKTYFDGLSSDFVSSLLKNRDLYLNDNEFVAYHQNNMKIAIDSFLTVFITFENSTDNLSTLLQSAKSEYKFLCTLNKLFDDKTDISISIPNNVKIIIDDEFNSFTELSDTLFAIV